MLFRFSRESHDREHTFLTDGANGSGNLLDVLKPESSVFERAQLAGLKPAELSGGYEKFSK